MKNEGADDLWMAAEWGDKSVGLSPWWWEGNGHRRRNVSLCRHSFRLPSARLIIRQNNVAYGHPEACYGSLCLKQMGVLTALNWRRFEKWDGSISIPLFAVYSYRLVWRLITAFCLQMKYFNSLTHVFGKRAWLITSLKLNFCNVTPANVPDSDRSHVTVTRGNRCFRDPDALHSHKSFSLTFEDFAFPLSLADKDTSQPIRQFTFFSGLT